MLDILILYDDWDLAKKLKEGFEKLDANLKIDFTVSHKEALKILAEENPKVLMLTPNFYGCDIEGGREYVKLIKEKLPGQGIVVFIVGWTIGDLQSEDAEFFDRLGVSLSDFPIFSMEEKKLCLSSIRGILKQDKEPIPEAVKKELLYNIPPDYGKPSRLDAVLRDFFACCKYSLVETNEMFSNHKKHPDEDMVEVSEALILRLKELLSIFEELLIILYRGKVVSEDIASDIEIPFQRAMMPVILHIKESRVNKDNLFGKKYAIDENYHWLAKILRFIAENLKKMDIYEETLFPKKVPS